MFFYILATGVSLSFFFMIWRISKMNRHDVVLYRFCELRRRTIRHLRDEDVIQALSRHEYISLRKMLEMLNAIILHYKSHRTIIFNLRCFVKYLADFKAQNKKAQCINSTNNEYIEELRSDIQSALLFAFMRYTPFIRSEIVIKVSIFFLGMLANAGVKRVNRYVYSLREAFELTHRHGHIA